MPRKVLKNVRGETIGFVDTDDHGRQSGKNVHGKLVGSYDPLRDQTFNVKRQLVSKGDTLSSLVADEDT